MTSSVETRQQLIAQINAQIVANGVGAITGPVLNTVLDNMVFSSIFYRGAWDITAAYNQLDVVTYNNASYIALLDNTSITPTNTTFWTLFSSGGPTGPTGTPGTPGGPIGPTCGRPNRSRCWVQQARPVRRVQLPPRRMCAPM
jgi:hypothetical protein